MSPKTDTLNRGDLAADLGDAYGVGLILAVPELLVLAYQSQGWTEAYLDENTGKIVKGKKTEGVEWDQTKIGLEIQNSEWYGTYDGSRRSAENARLSDAPTWQRNVNDIATTLQSKATAMGADLTGVNVMDLAEKILTDNYLYIQRSPDGALPDSVVNAMLVPHIKASKDGTFSGQAQTTASTLRQLADAYGVKMTDKWYLDTIQNLQSGKITDSEVRSMIVRNSQSTWSGMAQEINDTTSVKDLASTYIQTLASVWEMDPDSITLDTPEIRNALTYVDPTTGQPRKKTVWELERDARNDPRWDATAQGQKELSDAGMTMLRDFGLWK